MKIPLLQAVRTFFFRIRGTIGWKVRGHREFVDAIRNHNRLTRSAAQDRHNLSLGMQALASLEDRTADLRCALSRKRRSMVHLGYL